MRTSALEQLTQYGIRFVRARLVGIGLAGSAVALSWGCSDEASDGSEPSGGTNAGGGGATGTNRGGTAGASGGGATSSGGAASSGGAGGGAAGGAGGAGGSGGTASGGTASGGTASGAGGGAGADGGGSAGNGGSGGAPYKGVANSPCAARTALQVSWYYNWEQNPHEPCENASQGGEFVPMIWGHGGAEQDAGAIANALEGFAQRGDRFVLGFNEPDNGSQANIGVSQALTLWPAFSNASLQVGSPAAQANTSGTAWITDFLEQVMGDEALQLDFVAIHWYGWNAGSCEANASTLENYLNQIEARTGELPIWLTEWGCLNQSAPDDATVQAHVSGAIQMFAEHPRLVRYAWYPWAERHALNEADGSLTGLGEIYAAAPAYR